MHPFRILQPSSDEVARARKFEEIELLRQKLQPDWERIGILLDELGETLEEATAHAQQLHQRPTAPALKVAH